MKKILTTLIFLLLAQKSIAHQSGYLKSVLKEFPAESLYFYAAQGMVLAAKLAVGVDKDPLAIENYLQQPKDPVGHIAFFSFMLTHRFTDRQLGNLLRPRPVLSASGETLYRPVFHPSSSTAKVLNSMRGFFGMGAGMMASHITSELLSDTNLKKCAQEIIDQKAKSSCEKAYKDWVLSGRLTRYTPDFIILMGAVLGGSLTYMTGKAITLKMLKLSPHYLANASVPSKLFQFTTFFLADEVLRSKLELPLQNILYEGHFISPKIWDFGIVSSLKKEIKKDLAQGEFERSQKNLKNLSKESEKYYQAVTKKSSLYYANWRQNIEHFTQKVQFTYEFYLNVISRLTDKEQQLQENPYHGVGWKLEDKKMLSLWNESLSDIDFTPKLNRRIVEKNCLNLSFQLKENHYCSRLQLLRREHLQSLKARWRNLQDSYFLKSPYISSVQKQKELFHTLLDHFYQNIDIAKSIKMVNTMAAQESFAIKQSSALSSRRPWKKLQYMISGFEALNISQMWKNQKTQILKSLEEDPTAKEMNYSLKRFTQAKPLAAGLSYFKWFSHQWIETNQKSYFNRSLENKKIESLDHFFLLSLLCGPSHHQSFHLEKRLKLRFGPPRIFQQKSPLCTSKKKLYNVGLIKLIQQELKKEQFNEARFKRFWKQHIVVPLKAHLSKLVLSFEEGFVHGALKKDFSSTNKVTKNLRSVLISNFNFYSNLIGNYGVSEEQINQLQTKFSEKLVIEREDHGLTEIKNIVGADSSIWHSQVIEIISDKALGPISKKVITQEIGLVEVELLQHEYGHFVDNDTWIGTAKVTENLRQKIFSILNCSLQLSREEKNAVIQDIDFLLSSQGLSLQKILDLEQKVADYQKSIKSTIERNTCYETSASDATLHRSSLALVLESLQEVVLYAEWKIGQVREISNFLTRFHEEEEKVTL